VPAGRPGEVDRREGNGHHVDLGGVDPGLAQAKGGCFQRHAVLGMLVADKALLFGGGHQFAVDVQGGGGIVAEGAGEPQNGQSHKY
jgi:hypothetical protein